MGLAELEELILSCRSDQAKRCIREAVSCYHAGVYRSCVVTTWIAVVFDLVGKFRELEMAGDRGAREVLAQFTKYQENHDVESSLAFERDILDTAKDRFELLTPLEYLDLKRLQDDRNRCAHPSMTSAEEMYDPPAELARCHLRNAVTYLIQHPPVQGKAALERLMQEVQSEYFPVSVNEAVGYLKTGPLARPRESLTRNFVIVLLKTILLEVPNDMAAFRRFLTALLAVRSMHPQVVNTALEQTLNGIMRRVPDNRFMLVLWFVSLVGETWPYLHDDLRAKLRSYACSMPDDHLIPDIMVALALPALHAEATKRLEQVHAQQLEDIARSTYFGPIPAIIQRAVTVLSESPNYATANTVARALTQWASHLTSDQVQAIAEAVCTNDQAAGAFDVQPLLAKMCAVSADIREQVRSILRTHNCVKQWEGIIDGGTQVPDEIPF